MIPNQRDLIYEKRVMECCLIAKETRRLRDQPTVVHIGCDLIEIWPKNYYILTLWKKRIHHTKLILLLLLRSSQFCIQPTVLVLHTSLQVFSLKSKSFHSIFDFDLNIIVTCNSYVTFSLQTSIKIIGGNRLVNTTNSASNVMGLVD